MQKKPKPTVFISYSRKDEKWKNLLLSQLGVLEQQDQIRVWHDGLIGTGSDWYPSIQDAMADSAVAICLISDDFLSSGFIMKEEIPYLLEKRQNDGMLLLPIYVWPCFYQAVSWLKQIQMYPDPKTPLASLENEAVALKQALANITGVLFERINDPKFKLPTPKSNWPKIPKKNIDINRLPQTGKELFGRQKELQLLDEAWKSGDTNVVSLVAWGGVGKSTMINKWLEYLDKDNYRGAKKVFAWSFYSQGTNERVTSADQFINEALKWFGDKDPTKGSAWDKGERLTKLIRKERTLLVLDGMEPLQSTHDFEQGKIKDPALSILVTRLAKENAGLCVITTRENIAEIDKYETTTKQIDLEQISPQAGRALLRVGGVQGTDAELEAATKSFGKHALAINLLSSYLSDIPGHHISNATQIKGLKSVPVKKGKHPRRVIAAFAERFGNCPEQELLNILGLFDRPAPLGGVEAVKITPAIQGLTNHLVDLTEAKWVKTIANLRNVKLIAPESKHNKDTLDCHPLVREHFGEQLQKSSPEAWREAHSRLYDYYKNLPGKELPETLAEMEPLFAAMPHGCLAGKHQETYDEIHFKRICRKGAYYVVHQLGAFGSFLSALSNFFEPPWRQPSPGLRDETKATVLNQAGFGLQALGRLREAAAPLQAGLELRAGQKDWKNASIISGNLSELFLTLGQVQQAVDTARQSYDFSERSGELFAKYYGYGNLADALHQQGNLGDAEDYFRRLESLQKNEQPVYPYLYSSRGFKFCDLLLSRGRVQEVLDRFAKFAEWRQPSDPLLDNARENLSAGRRIFC